MVHLIKIITYYDARLKICLLFYIDGMKYDWFLQEAE